MGASRRLPLLRATFFEHNIRRTVNRDSETNLKRTSVFSAVACSQHTASKACWNLTFQGKRHHCCVMEKAETCAADAGGRASVEISCLFCFQVHQIAEVVVYEKISESDICSLVFGPRCGNMTASTHVWEVVVPSPLVKTPRTSQVRISDPT